LVGTDILSASKKNLTAGSEKQQYLWWCWWLCWRVLVHAQSSPHGGLRTFQELQKVQGIHMPKRIWLAVCCPSQRLFVFDHRNYNTITSNQVQSGPYIIHSSPSSQKISLAWQESQSSLWNNCSYLECFDKSQFLEGIVNCQTSKLELKRHFNPKISQTSIWIVNLLWRFGPALMFQLMFTLTFLFCIDSSNGTAKQ
jgi:hypothetical protein